MRKLSRRQFLRTAAAFCLAPMLPKLEPKLEPENKWHSFTDYYRADNTVEHYVDGKLVSTSQINYFSRYSDSLPEPIGYWPMLEQ